MMDLQAAIGIHQLERVETAWVRRKEIWDRYQKAFQGLPFGTPAEPDADKRHAYHLYTIAINKQACGISRDEMLTLMQQANIGVGVHYLSLAEHPFYQEQFGWRSEDYPVAAKYGSETVSLPL